MNIVKNLYYLFLCCQLAVKICSGFGENVESLLDLNYGDDLYNSYELEPEGNQLNNNTLPTSIDMPAVEEVPLMTPVARSLQDFSFEIFNAMQSSAPHRRNIVMSPLSIFTALTMLRPGLTGESLQQLNDVLGVESFSNDEIGDLFNTAFRNNREYKLRYANRIYVDRSVKLKKSYKNELQRLKVVQARRTDFAGNPSGSRNKMNRYVKNRTKKLIRELIPEGAISADTRLYLINALYLKANWNFRFSQGMTEMRRFKLDNENVILVPTMNTKYAICTVHRDNHLQADVTVLSLGDSLSMTFIMPSHPGNFSGFYSDEQEAMKVKLARLFAQIWPAEDKGERAMDICSLELPKFSIQYDADLMTSLRRLGIAGIFDAATADLSRMTQRRNGNLFVNDARHKAVIEANEGGIEAAASTSIGIQIRGGGAAAHVQMDRPFMFAIRHDATGALLFLGRVMRPEVH